MADSVTIARPYAQAAFDFALAHQDLALWHDCLNIVAAVVEDKDAERFLSNPSSTASQHSDLLMTIVKSTKKTADLTAVDNFIKTLAKNRRLAVLPDILKLFEGLRAEQEKTLVVQVVSYAELTKAEQQKLIDSLGKRLNRAVSLTTTIDKKLLGGAVIYANDLVIDGSVRGKINKLRTRLVA